MRLHVPLLYFFGISFVFNDSFFFFISGIGIDDTFVMLAAWRRTSVTKTVPERMGQTLSEAAVSITITSVTDTVSFFIGVFSPFRSVQLFCIYSGKISWEYLVGLNNQNTDIFKLVTWIDWLIEWLIDWLIDWMIVWLNDRSIEWFIDWMVYWLNDWLID